MPGHALFLLCWWSQQIKVLLSFPTVLLNNNYCANTSWAVWQVTLSFTAPLSPLTPNSLWQLQEHPGTAYSCHTAGWTRAQVCLCVCVSMFLPACLSCVQHKLAGCTQPAFRAWHHWSVSWKRSGTKRSHEMKTNSRSFESLTAAAVSIKCI